jgi:hypothetical protein
VGALTTTEQRLLVLLAARVVPASATLAGADRAAMLALIDDTVASRAPALRRQLHLFLGVLRWAPALRFLRPIDRLDGARQDAALRWFERHRLQVIRGGFWGVRTLVLLGFYGRPDVGPSIAYTPSQNGNAILHARARR